MAAGGAAWGLVRLARPLNAVLAAVGVLAGMMLSVGPMPGLRAPAWIAAPLAALLITGFGNVLNDIRDHDVDRVGHPKRPLPSGAVRPRVAWRLAVALLSMGLAAALLAGLAAFLFALCVVALLFLYESRLKRLGLSGNVAVALLTASTFLFGAVAQGNLRSARFAVVAAAMAFFANLAREVAKDIQDVDADRSVRRTLPMQLGSRNAAHLAQVAALAGVVSSWPFVAWHATCLPRQDLMVLTGIILAADVSITVGASLAHSRPAWAQRLLKLGMALALVAFLFVSPHSVQC